MCILALFFQEVADSPLIVAANRDEFFTRPSAPPQRLLEKPLVFGGKDLEAGGTWLGINEHGLLAGILNRRSKTDERGLRSRGLLCLDILRARDPEEAKNFLKRERASDYRPYNLLFASKEAAHVAYNSGDKNVCIELEKGLHVLTNSSVYDPRSEKLEHAYKLFSRAVKQQKETSGHARFSFIRHFKEILSDHTLHKEPKDPRDAICVHTETYGTVSSSIIVHAGKERRLYFYHAAQAPCRSEYGAPLALELR